jgi:hypothetical protein
MRPVLGWYHSRARGFSCHDRSSSSRRCCGSGWRFRWAASATRRWTFTIEIVDDRLRDLGDQRFSLSPLSAPALRL